MRINLRNKASEIPKGISFIIKNQSYNTFSASCADRIKSQSCDFIFLMKAKELRILDILPKDDFKHNKYPDSITLG